MKTDQMRLPSTLHGNWRKHIDYRAASVWAKLTGLPVFAGHEAYSGGDSFHRRYDIDEYGTYIHSGVAVEPRDITWMWDNPNHSNGHGTNHIDLVPNFYQNESAILDWLEMTGMYANSRADAITMIEEYINAEAT